MTSTIPELGSLRNYLAHYDGDLLRIDKVGHILNENLEETLKFLKIGKEDTKLTKLNTIDFINKVVFNFQTFIELGGGRINHPTTIKENRMPAANNITIACK
ncbi:hypothetical protein A5M85_09290 [Cellulophaga lytica]|nr:hypothetical protein A5M85_09290 [Cellulophaga lytica]